MSEDNPRKRPSIRVDIAPSLKRHLPFPPPDGDLEVEVEEGCTVKRLIEILGLPPEEVTMILVNREPSPSDRLLTEGDLVGLFPVLDGG